MSGGGSDPYGDLLGRFSRRKSEYLRRLTTDPATFELDQVANGVALRRGFIAGRGPRPQCRIVDQDAAIASSGNYLSVWTDSPCLRAIEGELWDSEDVRIAIARLANYSDAKAFEDSLVISSELPARPSGTFAFGRLWMWFVSLA